MIRFSVCGAAALIASIAPVSAGPADGAFAALLACDRQSMARMADSKAAFGPVTVQSKPGSRPGATYELDEATFAAPVEASGLHLLAFVRYVVLADGRPVAISFAFRTTEDAPTVARKIGVMLKDLESQQQGEESGWFVELEPEWHRDNDGTAIEHRHPLRMVLVRPSSVTKNGPAGMVECDLAEVRIDKAPPPKLADIFLVAPPGGERR